MHPVRILSNFSFDAQQILDCLPQDQLKSKTFDKLDQLAITHAVGKPDWFDGVGSLYDFDTKKLVRNTGDFSELNSHFQGTYMQKVVTGVRAKATVDGVKIGRIRLMRLKAKTCLSLHRDADEWRYHIPLITSGSSFFVVGESVYRMRSVGQLYFFETREYHTAVNANKDHDRYHLVFDTYDPANITTA